MSAPHCLRGHRPFILMPYPTNYLLRAALLLRLVSPSHGNPLLSLPTVAANLGGPSHFIPPRHRIARDIRGCKAARANGLFHRCGGWRETAATTEAAAAAAGGATFQKMGCACTVGSSPLVYLFTTSQPIIYHLSSTVPLRKTQLFF